MQDKVNIENKIRSLNQDVKEIFNIQNEIAKLKEELSEVRWFSMDELKHMVATGELNEDQIACFNKVCNYLENK